MCDLEKTLPPVGITQQLYLALNVSYWFFIAWVLRNVLPFFFCAAHKTRQIKEIGSLHSAIRVRNWSVRAGFGNRSPLTSQLEGARRQAETHFLVENIESEFCMTRDFSKTAKCSFFSPPLKTLPWLILLVPFLHCFYESVFIFASFLHSVGSSQVSRTWFALMSFQSQRPIHKNFEIEANMQKKKASLVVPFYFCLLNEVFYSVPLLSEGCDAALSHTEVAGCGVMTVCHCNLPVTHQWLGGN